MLSALALAWTLALQGQTPVPDASAQKEAEKVIRDVFKEDFAKKTPADRAALAGKMVAQAGGVKDDPPTAYVLYADAQDLYAQSGEIGKSLDTIDEMARTFMVDPLALKSAALIAAGRVSKSPEDAQRLGAAHLRFAGDALQADQYELAEKSIQAALSLAKKMNNNALAVRAAARAKDFSELKVKYEKIKKAKEVLASNAEDPAANFAVGQFQAVVKGYWTIGLPMLAKGSDAAYQGAAERDLAAPKEAADQAAAGDAWWDLAEKEAGTSKENLRNRAVGWYEKAQGTLTGLAKTKAEKRIQEVRFEKLNRGTWVDSSDARFFGKPSGTLELTLNMRSTLQRLPGGPFDGLQVRMKAKGEGILGVQYEPDKLDMELDVATGQFSSHHLQGTTWMRDVNAPCPVKEEYVMAVLLVDSECVFYLDGKEAFRRQAVNDHILGLQFYCFVGKVQVDQIKFRKKE